MKKLCKILTTVLMAALIPMTLGGCKPASSPAVQTSAGKKSAEITVFAAASLTESFGELGRDLLKSDNIKVNFDFAGSQELVQSIEQGSPADVAAFASMSYMKEMKSKGYVDKYSVFAKNKLVACKQKNNAKTISSLSDLAKPGTAIIAGDNTVPCGSYFLTVINSSKITDAQKKAVESNIKSKEMNVKDVLAKIQSGNGDFGIVYTTDITAAVKDSIDEINLTDFDAAKPQYPIATIKSSKNAKSAQKFVDLVLSDKGKAVLKKYKFIEG